MMADGLMIFRTNIDFKGGGWERACVDGQMGSVMKAYRDWKISGDDEWLRAFWPRIKKALAYAWSPENKDRWDPEKSGVITGRQHHTLDMELFGAYAWLTGFYHGALLAGAEMAKALGEEETAAEYLDLFERGHRLLEEGTFNGEYYVQDIDVRDKTPLLSFPEEAQQTYWCSENRQIKYQVDKGCEIDQVLADWHASLMGLRPIFEPQHRKSALKAIYRHNFKSMHDFSNPWRVFVCNEEKGLIICTYPDGVEKPKIPIPYAEECMTGFEYAAACGMLQCGMEAEALEIVAAVRERYDGKKRNPWAELECGASYSRAMASYSFLLAYSGFQYNLSQGMIGFKPLRDGRYFWSVEDAWGTAEIGDHRVELSLLCGRLELKRFVTSLPAVSAVSLNGRPLPFTFSGGAVSLQAALKEGDVLLFEE